MKTLPLLTFAVLLSFQPKAEARGRIYVGLGGPFVVTARYYTQSYPVYPAYPEIAYINPSPQRGYYTRPAPGYSGFTTPPPLASAPISAVPVAAPQGITRRTVQSDQDFLRKYNDESAAFLDSRLIQVQSTLRQRKYYTGLIDGLDGAETQTAIRTYQADRGMPITGRIDANLLADLRL